MTTERKYEVVKVGDMEAKVSQLSLAGNTSALAMKLLIPSVKKGAKATNENIKNILDAIELSLSYQHDEDEIWEIMKQLEVGGEAWEKITQIMFLGLDGSRSKDTGEDN